MFPYRDIKEVFPVRKNNIHNTNSVSLKMAIRHATVRGFVASFPGKPKTITKHQTFKASGKCSKSTRQMKEHLLKKVYGNLLGRPMSVVFGLW